MDHRLLEIIACPVCHGKLIFDKENSELICKIDHLAYPVRDNIPVLLENEARELSLEEEKKPNVYGHYPRSICVDSVTR